MLKLKAYAKINLSLKILGKRPDGYHEIASLMQSVSLFDLVTLELIPSGIILETNDHTLPIDQGNLAYRAAQLFITSQRLNQGVRIFLEKNIPVAAGLAGGSADAAAVLWGLNQLQTEDQRLKIEDLRELGEKIGSDVPFCLVGGTCWVRGRGEIVERVENKAEKDKHYILVVPELKVSTKWAYEAWDEKRFKGKEEENDLEPVVSEKYPVVKEIKMKLLALGCEKAKMSGSGPAVFGVCPNPSAAQRILEEVKKDFSHVFLLDAQEAGIELVKY